VYVASYLAPNGRYAGDNGYFASAGFDSPPLHALQNGVSGGNGVYAYGSGVAFPGSSYQSTNYWVDVVFELAAPTDTTAPTVSAITPASGATGVGVASTVTATFSEAMNASTVNASSFELRNAANALVAATVAYNTSTRVATLTPGTALAGSSTYTATVTTAVRDLAGNPMASNRVWSFTTSSADSTPPTVTAVSPANGATGVSGTANVTATFSEAMNATTVNGSTFELRDAANVLVSATVSYNSTTRVATLNPAPTLTPGAVYTATVRGGATDPRVLDVAGNPLAASVSWSFTVLPDTTAPTVTGISPSSGAILVARGSNVTATFSEAMDPATINGSTVELRGPGNVLVPAVVTYSTSNRRATLNPNANLAAFTTYTVTVRGGSTDPRVKDVAGNALAASRIWSFSTR